MTTLFCSEVTQEKKEQRDSERIFCWQTRKYALFVRNFSRTIFNPCHLLTFIQQHSLL
jgi:hypothetical protein